MRRVLVARYRSAEPWISAPDRLHELIPGRLGGFAGAVAWLFCREATLLCAFRWLPNHERGLGVIVPEALFATALLLVADLVFRWLAPDLGLEEVYGPFAISVTILLWGYTFGNIIVGAARLGANGFFFKSARIEYAPEASPGAGMEERDAARKTS